MFNNVEHGIALYAAPQHHPLAFIYGSFDPGVVCHIFAGIALLYLGHPEQAQKRSDEALTLAQELSHPFSLALALNYGARLHQFRREGKRVQERAEAVITLSTEQGFAIWLAEGTCYRGLVMAQQGQGDEGISEIREGLAALQAMGAEVWGAHWRAELAEVYRTVGQVDAALATVDDALA